MSAISVNDIKKLARLSALSINDTEAESLTLELEKILQYVEQLNDIDTTGIEPTYQVNNLETVAREDVAIDYGIDREDLLKNAPYVRDNQIEVRKVL